MEKIKRDAFLYMDPRANSDPDEFAQCETCRMFVYSEFFPDGKGARCVPFGTDETVLPDASCGAYLIWPTGSPSVEAMRVHALALLKDGAGSSTKEELGYVEREVRCENCTFFDDRKLACNLFVLLNQKFPSTFDLNTKVDAHGCCNAQTPRPA